MEQDRAVSGAANAAMWVSLVAATAWWWCGVAQAQTAGSAMSADGPPKVDAQGRTYTVRPLPEGFSADAPPAPTRPPNFFFDKNGVKFKPGDEAAFDRGGIAGEIERKPRVLDTPGPGGKPERIQGLNPKS